MDTTAPIATMTAVVVGTGTHVAGSTLPDVPAVAATVAAISDVLGQPGRVSPLVDPDSPAAFLTALTDAAARAEDALLFYYVGHGLVSLGGELYLATSGTSGDEVGLAVQALSFTTIRQALAGCRARYIVVVLDCCFSGRAHGSFGTAVADAFELSSAGGSFLLTATSATETALAPPGEPYTAFSGALLELLTKGDPGAPRALTLEDAYRYLARVLPRRGLPAPHRRVGGQAGELVLAINPAAPAVTRPRPPHDPVGPCPYPGLNAFTGGDARYFFGRAGLVSEALDTLADHARDGLFAIIGRSGAGKSSLLQAGVLPAIRQGRLPIPGSRDWPQVVIAPGEHPLDVLATRLPADRDGLVLCVDQFEEVFTVCSDERERRAFVQALHTVVTDRPALVILGVRADFYGHCLDYPELTAALTGGQIPVRPMTEPELRASIEGPADTVGLRLEEGLVDRLLLDLSPGADADTAAALPLLAHALQRTWQLSDGKELTLSDYQATGGIWDAVRKTAEETYAGLGEAQDAARTLLLALVRIGEGADDARQRIAVSDLLTGWPADQRGRLLRAMDAFVAARLITVDTGTAEIAHEALLRAWPRLRQWIDDDREELLARQRLTGAAREWESAGEDRALLYTGTRLENAARWLDSGDRHGPLSRPDRRFLELSRRAAASRRLRRRLYGAIAVAAALVLVAALTYALQQQAGDRDAQAVESSVQLAQEADNLRTSDPAAAMWLSLTAYHSSPTPQARTSLYESFITPYPVVLPGSEPGQTVLSVAYSPNGHVVAATWADGTVRLWDAANPLHPVLMARFGVGSSATLAFSPNGQLLAIHSQRALSLYQVSDPAHPAPLSSVPVTAVVPRGNGQIVPVAFSPDGRTVATGNGDGRFRLWDVADPRHPVLDASLAANRQAVNAVAFSPDGGTLAVASETTTETAGGGRVRLWDVRDVAHPTLEATLTVNSALSLEFSPVGHTLAAAGGDLDLHLWNVADPAHPKSVPVGSGATKPFGAGTGNSYAGVAFQPNGQGFVTADSGVQTDIWTSELGELSGNAGLPVPGGTFSVAYSPDGQHVLTGDIGGASAKSASPELAGAAVLWTSPVTIIPGNVSTQSPGSILGRGNLLAVNAPSYGSSSGDAAGPSELWNIGNPLRPVLVAKLPSAWTNAEFLNDDRTLITAPSSGSPLRLWSTSDSGRLVAGASLRDDADNLWSDNGNGLLAVARSPVVQIWDVRDPGTPVLEATIPEPTSLSSVWFLGNRLLGLVADSDLRLWNLADPAHPVKDGDVRPEAGIGVQAYQTQDHILSEQGPADGFTTSDTSLWDLTNPAKPREVNDGIGADPNTVSWINPTTMVGATADDSAIALWNISRPIAPVQEAAQALQGDSSGAGWVDVNQAGTQVAEGFSNAPDPLTEYIEVSSVSADDKDLTEFAELPSDGTDYTFTQNDQGLVAEIDMYTDASELGAFDPYGTGAVVYPLDTDTLYNQLCSETTASPDQSWYQYLPKTTYYRQACS